MGEKTCRKCGETTAYSVMEPLSCMGCGAVYRKVEEALQRASEAQPSKLPQMPQMPQMPQLAAAVRAMGRSGGVGGHYDYIYLLRSESLYPTWRQLVTLVTLLWYVVAALMLLGGLITAFKGSFYAGIGGACGALFIAIVAKVGKELAFMLADLSDATVRMAAKAEADRP